MHQVVRTTSGTCLPAATQLTVAPLSLPVFVRAVLGEIELSFSQAQDLPIVPTLEHTQGLIGAELLCFDSERAHPGSTFTTPTDAGYVCDDVEPSTVLEEALDMAAARDFPRAIDKDEKFRS
ncbi:hypothetical protein BU15DRAFT_76905 [Melanogaster broomeanus]|nr:hypothetical protein BU15DRAFT_76905 [Melanogaster broomeanus]